MKAKLVIVNGGAESSEVNLELPVIIGRGRRAGVLLPHSSVSRQHCELYETDGQLIIRDLGSMNGTFVNQQRIAAPTVLRPGDTLKLGSLTFRAEFGDNNYGDTEYGDNYATQTDAKDETAIGHRYDREQPRKTLAPDSSAANAVDDEPFAADELDDDELEDVERLAILPVVGAQQPLPATRASTLTESPPLVSDDRPDAPLRKLQ